jgi:hypothetical protein
MSGTTNFSNLSLKNGTIVHESSGTIVFPGAVNMANLALSGGTVNQADGGTVTFSGTVVVAGAIDTLAVQTFTAIGTVTNAGGMVRINSASAGFNVILPAPAVGKSYHLANMQAPASGSHAVSSVGGTFRSGDQAGTALAFGTVGQGAIITGVSTTVWQVMSNVGTVAII